MASSAAEVWVAESQQDRESRWELQRKEHGFDLQTYRRDGEWPKDKRPAMWTKLKLPMLAEEDAWQARNKPPRRPTWKGLLERLGLDSKISLPRDDGEANKRRQGYQEAFGHGELLNYTFERNLAVGGQGIVLLAKRNADGVRIVFKWPLRPKPPGRPHMPLITEARNMRRMRRAAHATQLAEPDKVEAQLTTVDLEPDRYHDDSSDDAPDSEDDSHDDRPLRPARPRIHGQLQRTTRRRPQRPLNAREIARDSKMKAMTAKRVAWHISHPTGIPVNPNPLEYLATMYSSGGDLSQFVCKANRDADRKPPSRLLWHFWLCLIKGCIGMAYPPRNTHPDRKDPAKPSAELDEVIPKSRVGGLYSLRDKRPGRMLHFDIDPGNILVDGEDLLNHSLGPRLKIADFGVSVVVKDQKRNAYYEPWRKAGKPLHLTPEQFHPRWDSMLSLSYHDPDLNYERIAGNFASHTNLWQAALVMFTVISGYEAPGPLPFTRSFDVGPSRTAMDLVTYGGLLLDSDPQWDYADLDLRTTLARCMCEDPVFRPSLRDVLVQAEAKIRQAWPEHDSLAAVHDWLQNATRDAPAWPAPAPAPAPAPEEAAGPA